MSVTAPHALDAVDAAVLAIRSRSALTPRVALILGTGLGGLARAMEVETMVAYAEIPQPGAGGACRHRIYTATNDRRLIALDARNGRPCEQFGVRGEVELAEHERYGLEKVSSSSPPVVANGVVVVGSSVIDFAYAEAPRGVIAAFDAATGAPRLTFDPPAGAPLLLW